MRPHVPLREQRKSFDAEGVQAKQHRERSFVFARSASKMGHGGLSSGPGRPTDFKTP